MKILLDNIFILNIPFALFFGFITYLLENSDSKFIEILVILHSTLCLISLLLAIIVVLILYFILNIGSLRFIGIIGTLPLIYRIFVFFAECILCPVTFFYLIEESVNILTFLFLTTQIFVVLVVSINFLKDILSNPPVNSSVFEIESQKSLYSIDEQELKRIEIEVIKARENFI